MTQIKEEFFSALGLVPMQGKVYLAALELGVATMQELARKSGVNRSTIYTFIEDLKSRGLVLETAKGKRRVYSAVHPERLVEMQKARSEQLEKLLPELLAVNNNSTKKPRVTFHEGIKGIEEVYADMLRAKKEISAYEDLDHLKEGLPSQLFEYFPKERAKRDILIRSISRDTPFAREFSQKNRGLLRETKFIHADEFRTDINIYGDKVALMDLREEPSCVLIENRHLAETMRALWQALWNRLGEKIA